MKAIADLMKKKITIDQIRRHLIVLIGDQERIRKVTEELYRKWLKDVISPDDDDDLPID